MRSAGDAPGRPHRIALAGLLAAGLSAAGVQPVSAECDGPIPSFREATSTAKRIVIGDVIALTPGGLVEAGADGRSSRFFLQIRYVLRGEAPSVMEIRDLPTQPCAPSLIAAEGDRLALAFDATDFTPPIKVNTVAWIRGMAPDWIGIETITVPEAFALVGLDPPDTSIEPEPVDRVDPTTPALLGVMTGLLALVVLALRFRRRH
jgi:hypothetical protein